MIAPDENFRADTPAAVDFLMDIGGQHLLAAINPLGGAPECAAFAELWDGEAAAWIEARQGKLNLYYTANEVRQGIARKPRKTDIASQRAFQVDIDCQRDGHGNDLTEEKAAIFASLMSERPATIPEPSVIIDSGNGYQALWAHEAPVSIPLGVTDAQLAQLEAINKALAKALNGDDCHNIDRLLRLPGTINLPNQRKVAKGRIPKLASVVHHSGRKYSAANFSGLLIEADKEIPQHGHRSPSIGAPVSVAILEDMLRCTDPDCSRNQWLIVCAGLVTAPVPGADWDGLELFIRWSRGDLHGRRAVKFASEDDCEAQWQRDMEKFHAQ